MHGDESRQSFFSAGGVIVIALDYAGLVTTFSVGKQCSLLDCSSPVTERSPPRSRPHAE
jgi:hypothetical protein